MNKIYKFNYHWLNELSKHKDMLDNDTRILVTYIEDLQQENKQLNSILTELEEWLKAIMENASLKWGDNCAREFDLGCLDIEMTMKNYGEVLDKIQKLKEKYKNV